MTTHGYARVSTREQTLQSQLDQLRAEGCDNLHSDVASGARADRPGLTNLLETLVAADTLVVVSLDRLGRSMPELVRIVHDLNLRKINFRSLREQWDTSSSTGRLMFHVLASLAEFERERLRERTSEGLRAARTRGRIGGRPAALSPADIKRARQLIDQQGLSIPEVARVMAVGKSTLYRQLAKGKVDDPTDQTI